MSKSIIMVTAMIAFNSCQSSETTLGDLVYSDFKYHLKDRAFNGKAYVYFDNGDVSGFVSFKNGIPDGEWVVYGYQGEIVQTGKYEPVEVEPFNNPDIKRLNYCETKEGEYTVGEVVIISDKSDFNAFDTLSIKNNIQKSYPKFKVNKIILENKEQ